MTGQHRALVAGALGWFAPVMAGCLVLGLVLAGVPGLLGAGLATTVVLLVLGLGLVAMIVTTDVAPAAALGVAFLTYLLSVLAVGAVLVGAAAGPEISRPAFAVSAIAQSAAWLAGMARAHRKWVRQGNPPDFPVPLRGPVVPPAPPSTPEADGPR